MYTKHQNEAKVHPPVYIMILKFFSKFLLRLINVAEDRTSANVNIMRFILLKFAQLSGENTILGHGSAHAVPGITYTVSASNDSASGTTSGYGHIGEISVTLGREPDTQLGVENKQICCACDTRCHYRIEVTE